MSESVAPPVTPSELQIGLDPDLAIKSFFKDPDWVLKTAVGGVWNASSLLLLFFINSYPVLIPIMFTLWAINTGYLLRVIRTKLRDPQGVLPSWNDWQDLFVSGMTWLAIITGVIVIFLFMGATNLLIASILAAIKQYSQLFALYMSGSIILLLAFSLLTNLVLAATMANFAQQESSMAAFAYFKVLKRIWKRPGDFFAAWMLGLGIQALSIIIPCVTIIGIFFLPSTAFAGQLIASILLAQAWASAETATEVNSSKPSISDAPLEFTEQVKQTDILKTVQEKESIAPDAKAVADDANVVGGGTKAQAEDKNEDA